MEKFAFGLHSEALIKETEGKFWFDFFYAVLWLEGVISDAIELGQEHEDLQGNITKMKEILENR
jgi:hypothetical protein